MFNSQVEENSRFVAELPLVMKQISTYMPLSLTIRTFIFRYFGLMVYSDICNHMRTLKFNAKVIRLKGTKRHE